MTGRRTSTKTGFKPNAKFVTLRFRSKDDYDPDKMAKEGIDENDYVTVLNMPLREMTQTAPAKLAGEILEYMLDVNGPPLRRAAAGDVFYRGEEPWMFVRPGERRTFEGASILEVEIDKTFHDLLIVPMETEDASPN